MTGREYRQDDRTDGYCPRCGEPLSAMTTDTRGFCEVHGWQWCDWRPRRLDVCHTCGQPAIAAASSLNPGGPVCERHSWGPDDPLISELERMDANPEWRAREASDRDPGDETDEETRP